MNRAVNVPATRPHSAADDVIRFQNMPMMKVANSGALKIENSACREFMRLLYDEAISAVRMLIAMPPIVAMRPKRTYHSSDWPGLKYGSTRSVVTTVLNALTFSGTPAMNDAIRPVSAIPSIPLGRYWFINSGTEL